MNALQSYSTNSTMDNLTPECNSSDQSTNKLATAEASPIDQAVAGMVGVAQSGCNDGEVIGGTPSWAATHPSSAVPALKGTVISIF